MDFVFRFNSSQWAPMLKGRKPKKWSKPLKSLFSYGAKYQIETSLANVTPSPFSPFYFILIYFHYLTFQLSTRAGISRSRCFLQRSTWMKMLISNIQLLQEKWAHKVVVAEERSIYECCSVDLKEWLNAIQYVHEILPMLFNYWHVNCKLWFKPVTLFFFNIFFESQFRYSIVVN